MVEVEAGARMVATQLLLMNHFLMSLSHNSADFNTFHNINSVAVDPGECSYGCTKCSPINGCLACKPPFFLLLHREGIRQTASCTRSCPKGFYKLKKKRNGFCAKCTMRGCVDCLDSRYCSSCDTAYVNFFGKCIKPRSGEAREDLGLYTTTRRPNPYATTPEIGVTTEANSSSLSSQDPSFVSSTVTPIPPSTVETFAITQRTNSSFHTTAVAPSSPPVTETRTRTTSAVYHQLKTSPSSTPATSPGIATRFYFTTPTSPLLSEKFASGISPYPSRTIIRDRKPCRSKSNRRPGDRKYKKGRKGRKKNHKDRKYRRRKGRRGQKHRRRSCRRKEKNRRKNNKTRVIAGSFQPTPPSQDPTMRQLNSAEPRDDLNVKLFPNQGKVSVLGTSSSDRTVDDLKVSLLEETDRLSPPSKGQDSWPKDLALHFQNRPGTMVAFKTSLALRNKKKKKETSPFYHNGHRLRHGRSRAIPSRSSGGGELSPFDRNPRTKSGQRRRRRINRRPRKRPGKVSSSRTS